MDLSRETVLVTSADRGIGRALTEELAKRDVRLLAGMRDTGNFTPVSQRAAREVRPVRMAVSSRDEIEACFSQLNGERALRRELQETGVTMLEVVTPGGGTDMLAEVRQDYEPHIDDTSKIKGIEASEWEKLVAAIEDDDYLLNPTGAERLAKRASRGPGRVLDAVLGRVFER